jgi:hypothetical protein
MVTSVRELLKEKGCSSELSHLPSLISVDVPKNVEIQPILEMLQKGETSGLWSYEEASIRHP